MIHIILYGVFLFLGGILFGFILIEIADGNKVQISLVAGLLLSVFMAIRVLLK